MSNMHRINWFDQQIRAHNYPNRETLAEKFEISTRQAQRDIDYLKETMGAPVKYDAKKRGYYYEDEAFVIPNIYINEDIKKMLGYLAYNYSNHSQTPKVAQMAELFKKLTGEDGTGVELPVFDLEKPVVHTYYNIYNAIRNRNKLKIMYKDPHKGDIQLTIHPYKVFHKYRADYLASGMDSGEIITLRLDRIVETWIMEDKFKVASDFDDTRYNSFVKREPYTARIKFSKTPVFQNSQGINIKQIEEFVYEIEFYEIDDFLNRLMNIDYWEIIYSPKWLKQRLKERCARVLDKLEHC